MKALEQYELRLGDEINLRCFDKALNRGVEITGTFLRYETLDLGDRMLPLARYIDADGNEAIINLKAVV